MQIQTPLLEYTDLFSRSLGDGSDIVMKVWLRLLLQHIDCAYDEKECSQLCCVSLYLFAWTAAGDVHFQGQLGQERHAATGRHCW